jgi:CheY-like chemotaxis protein
VRERTAVLTDTNRALQEEIVERRRVEAELVAAREQALQAAEAKATFLANMSHEIRTPMNAVIGMTALLEDTSLDGEQRSYVQTIHTSGDALLSTINDILDFSKTESGMLELERRPFELGVCIEEAFDMVAPKAADKGIDLLYELMDNVPHWLVGDSTRLRQVLVNLLSNAVKFTDVGEVCLTASVLKREPEHVQLRFAVRDTGIGIPPQHLEHLFKAFSQGDAVHHAALRRHRPGPGDQRAAGAPDGGRHPRGERGAQRLGVLLHHRGGHRPERAHRAVPLQPRARAGRPQGAAGRRQPTNLHILKTQCTRWGMEVACASRGTHALALLEAEGPFDAAVLDLHMPNMDGLQLARAICAQKGDAAPPLVLLSSSPGRTRDQGAMRLFAATLAKPVKHSRLFAVLDEVIHQRRAAPAPSPAHTIDHALAQRLPMNILVVEDSEINRKLAVNMLRKFGYACEVAEDGRQAVEKVRNGRFDLVFMDLQMPVMDGLEATRQILSVLSGGKRPAHRGDDGQRAAAGPAALPGRRHGRLHRQADPAGDGAGADRAVGAAAARARRDGHRRRPAGRGDPEGARGAGRSRFALDPARPAGRLPERDARGAQRHQAAPAERAGRGDRPARAQAGGHQREPGRQGGGRGLLPHRTRGAARRVGAAAAAGGGAGDALHAHARRTAALRRARPRLSLPSP